MLGVVRDERHVRTQESSDRFVQPRKGAAQMGGDAGAAAGDADHLERLRIGERASPPGRAGEEQSGGGRPEHGAPPVRVAPEPPSGRGHRGRGHEVCPERQARERAPQDETSASGRAARERRAEPQGEPEHGRGEEQGRWVHRRRERGQQQEVRRRAGHQHGRGQGRPRIERPRQRVGGGDEAEPEEEVHEAQGRGVRPQEREQRHRDPGFHR